VVKYGLIPELLAQLQTAP